MGQSFLDRKLQHLTTRLIRATTGRKQVKVVYDLEDKLNKLADEVDEDAGMSRLTLFSPCKVIGLGDKISSLCHYKIEGYYLSTNAHGVHLDERNLIIKALNLFRRRTGIEHYFFSGFIVIRRRPTGAGLGGGGGNAATALWTANQFSGCVATEKELQEWSSEIGSDIPFFFSHGAAYCTSRGKIVEDILPPIALDLPMVLIKPQEACHPELTSPSSEGERCGEYSECRNSPVKELS
ncbi:UNVERIFIED_CONTAM: 4-diphosphocytidyl-2-C-methyl-D-erythritol kinase, chloroplastic [Sesamum latifolium]|uniref:4-diphosphocytidyl-2-C-methyl-D-erythritol kinase, chloroplastic n=1 Tax=Sesamum latifolium TaxID=2727402 RepID=A0AAW2Y5H6_9LAMI